METTFSNFVADPTKQSLFSNSRRRSSAFHCRFHGEECSALEQIASVKVMMNMIVYLTKEYRMEAAQGANVLFFWLAATNFMPVVGAFLADSYVGRFPAIAFGSFANLLGLLLLWLTSVLSQAKPPPCIELSRSCQSATTFQLLLLYSSFVLTSIGIGGIRSSCLAFGADQLITGKALKNGGNLETYISWYYVISCVAIITIWSTRVFTSVTITQSSFRVLQASTMDRQIISNINPFQC